jgi:hypothetical protein
MHDHGLVEDQGAAPLVVSPNTLRLGVGGRAPEDSPQRGERLFHPSRLVRDRLALAVGARNEEHQEDRLSSLFR